MNRRHDASTPVIQQGWWTREHANCLVLVVVTGLLLVSCSLLMRPFFGAMAWALAIAVVGHPVHAWLSRRLRKPNLAAGLAVFLVSIIIIGPTAFVGHQIVKEAAKGIGTVQSIFEKEDWQEQMMRDTRFGPALRRLNESVDLGVYIQGMAKEMGKQVGSVVAGSAWAAVELILTLFVLFFFFRDRVAALAALRSLVPLSKMETTAVFARVADTVSATIYGTLVVAMVQGTLGGLMFWWLGLPMPLLWGAVMALLAIVPVLGAFVIWIPAAVFLAASGQWGKAAILAGWGGIVISLIDNLLYPILVGKKLHLHTMLVFFSIVGGLGFFGASGIVLGPVLVTVTLAILDIWRRRTAHARPADAADSSTAG